MLFASRPEHLRQFGAGVLIAFGFLVIGFLTLGSYGQTWDEAETRAAALLDLGFIKAVVSGAPAPVWPTHELPGYYFIVDVLRGAFSWIISRRLLLMDEILAFHLFQLVLSSLSVFLLFLLAVRVSGRLRIGILSAMILALFPQFVAHSQNNPKDLPGVFAFLLAIYALSGLGDSSPARRTVYSGLALGFALTTHVGAVFVLPLVFIWQLATRRTLGWKRYAIVVVTAAVTAFVCWPWLWSAPWTNVVWAIGHIASRFHLSDLTVLYLGNVYNAWELPWHYSLVSFLATTPVLYLALAVVSLRVYWSRDEGSTGNPRSAATLGWAWCAIILAAETRAPMRYDGVRHLLIMVPGFCLVAAVGLDSIMRFIERTEALRRFGRVRSVAALACAAILFSWTGFQMVRIHPYHNAYLNEVTNASLASNAEDVFEVEYWCQSYKEGAEWLNAHAERGSAIYVAWPRACADPYLNTTAEELDVDALPRFADPARPAYFMVMTRKAMYSEPIKQIVGAYKPVFMIRRQKGTLLRIYFNRPSPPG